MKNAFFLLLLASMHMVGSAQIPKKVLIEMTTSTQCHFCPRANLYIDSVALQSPTKSVVLRYQSPFSGYDPIFFQDSSEIVHRLRSVYGNPPEFGLPGANYNGKYFPTDPYAVTTELIDSIFSSGSHFALSIQHHLTVDYDSLEITLDLTSDTIQTFLPGSLKAFVILMEDSIQFPTPPGTNGEKEFYFECRKFVQGPDGIALPESWSQGMTVTYTYQIPIPSYIYNLNNIYALAFIQNMTTSAVLQSEKDEQIKVPAYAGIDKHHSFGFPPFTCNPVLSGTKVVIRNMGSQPLLNFRLVYKLDQKIPDTIVWAGTVLPDSTTTLTLPDLDISVDGKHNLTAQVILPNGHHITPSFATVMTSSIEQNQIPESPPLHAYFTSPGFPYPGWCVFNPNRDGNSWQRVSYPVMEKPYPLSALQLRSKTMMAGTINEFILPDENIKQLTSMALSFDVAHIRTEDTDDTLQVFASTDCGANWVQIFSKNSHEIAFTSVGQFEFIGWLPDSISDDWKNQYIDLSSFAGNDKIQIKFRLIHEESNDIYLRNIFFGPHTGIAENHMTFLRIYPNPVSGGFCMVDQKYLDLNSQIEILNLMGSVLYSNVVSSLSHPVNIDVSGFSPGIYIVRTISGRQQFTGKLVISN